MRETSGSASLDFAEHHYYAFRKYAFKNVKFNFKIYIIKKSDQRFLSKNVQVEF